MLTAFLFFVMIACVAFLWNEGLWGNAITLINVVMAALIATNYFEPLASFVEGLDDSMATFTYLWDFLCIWFIFVVVYSIMRAVTDKLTKTKVKFKGVVEMVGRSILAVIVGYVVMSFTCMTLHLAPLAEHPFGGSFHRATAVAAPQPVFTPSGIVETDNQLPTHFLFLAPDRQWLGFVQSRSWAADDNFGSGPLARWWGQRTFDPKSRFIFKYGARRRKHEEHNKRHGFGRVDVKANQ